jgi:CubicO group peptidase (beta-lactamase class C family)
MGERMLGSGKEMTAETVFAIFSTTKAITGTAIIQCVEEGKLDLDAPAKDYVPDIGKLQVIEGFDALGKPATPAGTGLRWPLLRAGERGSVAPRGSHDRATEDHNCAVERTAQQAPLE